eukprot:181841_1
MGNSNQKLIKDAEKKGTLNLNNSKNEDDGHVDDDKELIENAKKQGIITDCPYRPKYIHKVDEEEINCPHLLESKSEDTTNDPLKCPIYEAMKNKYQFNQNNLNH